MIDVLTEAAARVLGFAPRFGVFMRWQLDPAGFKCTAAREGEYAEKVLVVETNNPVPFDLRIQMRATESNVLMLLMPKGDD